MYAGFSAVLFLVTSFNTDSKKETRGEWCSISIQNDFFLFETGREMRRT
jgi:hypothetical protein